jgi:hypothetical protein
MIQGDGIGPTSLISLHKFFILALNVSGYSKLIRRMGKEIEACSVALKIFVGDGGGNMNFSLPISLISLALQMK